MLAFRHTISPRNLCSCICRGRYIGTHIPVPTTCTLFSLLNPGPFFPSPSREQAAALARSHEDAAGRLAQLHMPDLLKAAEGQAGALAVPSGLRTFLEELSERGGAETILEAMTKQLQQLRAATADMLVAAVQALDEEGGVRLGGGRVGWARNNSLSEVWVFRICEDADAWSCARLGRARSSSASKADDAVARPWPAVELELAA